MAEFYVFNTEAEANDCINAINGTSWFPIVSSCCGELAPGKQQTTKWCEVPREMLNGKYAVQRIPTSRLDFVGVPQAERDAFLALYGQDIRELEATDFVTLEE
jgi:hypothetical protein